MEKDYLKFAMGYSMMTVKDQSNDRKAFMMNFVEFMEAIVRVSFDFSAHPVDYSIGYDGKRMTFDTRYENDVWKKLEGMCKILLNKCCDKIL